MSGWRSKEALGAGARVAALVGGLSGLPALGSPLLRCEVEQAGNRYTVDATPVADPYGVVATPVGKRFRLKAVMLADEAGRPAYVKLATYYGLDDAFTLLHQVSFTAPPMGGAQPFTGEQWVYAPGLGRDLHYHCTLREVQP